MPHHRHRRGGRIAARLTVELAEKATNMSNILEENVAMEEFLMQIQRL